MGATHHHRARLPRRRHLGQRLPALGRAMVARRRQLVQDSRDRLFARRGMKLDVVG
jgi:hypothetical protein